MKYKFYLSGMQRSLAIVLISVFALSQYAKELCYLQCRLTNKFIISTTIQHCDCEKQSFQAQPASKEFPVAKTQLHTGTDEFYTSAKINPSDSKAFLLRANFFSPYNNVESIGNFAKLYRPPRF